MGLAYWVALVLLKWVKKKVRRGGAQGPVLSTRDGGRTHGFCSTLFFTTTREKGGGEAGGSSVGVQGSPSMLWWLNKLEAGSSATRVGGLSS